MNICALGHLKDELAWAIDKWLWVTSNKMLFKTVIPLRKKEEGCYKYKTILYALLCGP